MILDPHLIGTNASVNKEPDPFAERVAALNQGDQVRWYEERVGWYLVKTAKGYGWVNHALVRETKLGNVRAVQEARRHAQEVKRHAVEKAKDAVRRMLSNLTEAFNSRNISEVRKYFTDDAMVKIIDQKGKQQTYSKDEYLEVLESAWKKTEKYKGEFEIVIIIIKKEGNLAEIRTTDVEYTKFRGRRYTTRSESNTTVVLIGEKYLVKRVEARILDISRM